MVNFEVASSNSFRDIRKNHFMTAAAEAPADIDDSIKRKRKSVSLKNRYLSVVRYIRNINLIWLNSTDIDVHSVRRTRHDGQRISRKSRDSPSRIEMSAYFLVAIALYGKLAENCN